MLPTAAVAKVSQSINNCLDFLIACRNRLNKDLLFSSCMSTSNCRKQLSGAHVKKVRET